MKSETAADQTAELDVFLRQVRYEGRNIHSYEFVDPEGGELPPFSAGAHIDLHLGDGVLRQYSLCNPPGERHRYVIAVLRDAQGRGGSQRAHDRLRVQDRVRISRSRATISGWSRTRAKWCCWPAASASRRSNPWSMPCRRRTRTSSCTTARARRGRGRLRRRAGRHAGRIAPTPAFR